MVQPGKAFSDTKHCSPLLATGTSTQSCIEAFSTAGRFHVASTIGGGWWGYEIWSVRKLHHLRARMVPILRSGLAYHGKGMREAHLRSIMRTACLTTSSNHWGSPLWIIKDCQYTTYWPRLGGLFFKWFHLFSSNQPPLCKQHFLLSELLTMLGLEPGSRTNWWSKCAENCHRLPGVLAPSHIWNEGSSMLHPKMLI